MSVTTDSAWAARVNQELERADEVDLEIIANQVKARNRRSEPPVEIPSDAFDFEPIPSSEDESYTASEVYDDLYGRDE